ncbi:YigZ family protein [Actinoallomurus bryophytorum]|uniref:Putative YigZ family protein n=1 Tax=Actinoallomurus bryophytorum TaxID=1490222 RepID=A0A543BTE4_9ACTN|nr:YigZ family protein [Actinoallomurus bryophytorum]TQL88091.1 putative YigZ family protein [Actinoallomurus bryophytorum]
MHAIKQSGVHELEIRRSRFVCALARVTTEPQAQEFIAGRRRSLHDASHHCTAYVLGEHGDITRSNDDGEPGGTAGRPMLEVLGRRELTGTVAVVSRYFGGIKLGAGGLVRAYGQAVAETVDLVGVVERRPVVTVTVISDHAHAGRLTRDLHASPYTLAGARYGGSAEIDVVVPAGELEAFDAWVAAAGGGRARTRRGQAGHVEVPADRR